MAFFTVLLSCCVPALCFDVGVVALGYRQDGAWGTCWGLMHPCPVVQLSLSSAIVLRYVPARVKEGSEG